MTPYGNAGTATLKSKRPMPWPDTPAPTSSLANPVNQAPTTVQQGIQNTTNTLDKASGAVSATQPYIDRILKPNAAGTTDFRQALTNTKASSTANAYDNAVARTREKAQVMGFASNPQPITLGAETG